MNNFFNFDWSCTRPKYDAFAMTHSVVANLRRTIFKVYRHDETCGDGYRVVGCATGTASRNGSPTINKKGGTVTHETPYIFTGRVTLDDDPDNCGLLPNDILIGRLHGKCDVRLIVCTFVETVDNGVNINLLLIDIVNDSF